jgi:hypothetical protein
MALSWGPLRTQGLEPRQYQKSSSSLCPDSNRVFPVSTERRTYWLCVLKGKEHDTSLVPSNGRQDPRTPGPQDPRNITASVHKTLCHSF